ncbi:MAG: selenoprotein B glycine/betaine/sarcosine/D-proline reductase [Chloroflexi bacterium]|nr:selenoprotein B glycine/betaine/sarcosine/D-proline reductase [Chloroflexota bacterium]
MARLEKLDAESRKFLENVSCPTFENQPCVKGPPLAERRIAIISTAGLHQSDDRPFTRDPGDFYRIIPGDIKSDNLVMSHASVNFDRSGFYQDWNVVFPIDRLRELAGDGVIGSVAGFHYSFMGADDPLRWEQTARQLAGLLKRDSVDGVLLVPV